MAQVTSSGSAKVTLPADQEILITREFDASKHLVYKAYTTPELGAAGGPGSAAGCSRPRSTCGSAGSGAT